MSISRCHADQECEADDETLYQGSGSTICNPNTGMPESTVTEHCAGDCVAQHEATHRRDIAECCKRRKKCRDNAGGDQGKIDKCDDAWRTWLRSIVDWTECNAYTVEVTCLEKLIAKECGGATEAAIGALEATAEAVGSVFGVGPAAQEAAGAAATALGGVTPECCKTLSKVELPFAKKMKKKHCAKAKNNPCPFRPDGTII